jgi:4-hydroxybenzoate polyprenyltransferase
MATTIASGDRSAGVESAGEKRFKPVTAWAIAGVVFLAVMVTAYAGWLLSGDAKAVPRGTGPVPT